MAKYIIQGKVPLKGKVRISGAKNAAIKEIAASLLTTETISLENIPDISDVDTDLDIVKSLGIEVNKPRPNSLVLRSPGKLRTVIPKPLCSKSRAAIITVGPLLAREGEAVLSAPGGCSIDKRPLDRHLTALEALGASFETDGGSIKGKAAKLKGGRITFEKNTVMGTENAILAAVLAEGETEIRGAAMEPEVDDLIELLVKMGARVARDETDPRLVMIEGVQTLGGAKHTVVPDRNEAVTFAIAAIVTRGDVVLTDLEVSHLTAFLAKLDAVGVRYDRGGPRSLRVGAEMEAKFSPVDITTAPYPGFMTDWQQPFTLLLTQAQGESFVHETIYTNRLGYLSELAKFGARVSAHTPEELDRPFESKDYGFNWSRKKRKQPQVYARISGPTLLTGANVEISDLRAGATLVLAALAAEGKSEVSGIEHIERGYERFEEKLRALGANIERSDT